jgi:hypothetical protein
VGQFEKAKVWKALLDLGATEKEMEKFLNNNAFSPIGADGFCAEPERRN